MMNFLPALLLGGPPNSGKSVLFYNIARALREQSVPHYALRACPDGEGNWFHEFDQEKVRLIRVKGNWTNEFVQQICLDLQRRHLPLLVDIGGQPGERDACIFRNCTHSLLLLQPDQEENANLWRHLVQVNGLLPLAELFSRQSGLSTLDTTQAMITGTFTGLERGALAHGSHFDTLVERIALLFTSYTLEELEQTKLDMAPVELVVNLETFIHKWAPQTKRWECTMLPQLLASLPAKTPLAVYGPGPNWLYAALAAHAGQQPLHQFDPRIGWITPPSLRISTTATSKALLQLQIQNHEQATMLSLRILNDHLDYLQANQLSFPPLPIGKGLVLDGRFPHWLLTALVRLYSHAGVIWIACRQIQLEGAVVVVSRTPDQSPGHLVMLPSS